jgi:thiol-disulfide isomerase/thioredoxin
MLTWLLRIGVTLAAAYVAFGLTVFALMHASNPVAGKTLSIVGAPAFILLPMERMWVTARRGSLRVGQEAPDFELPTRDGRSKVRLSSLRGGRPVVLLFGSYTCPPFRSEMPAVIALQKAYAHRVDFYFVYIEEAHAHDVWPLASNARDHVVYATAKDAAERSGVAQACTTALKIDFPTLVDGMTNGVAQAYTAWPTRMYVVDPAGRIAFKSKVGPFGFQAAPLASALAALAPEP